MGLAVQGAGNHQQVGILGHQPEVGSHQVWGSQAVVEGSLQEVLGGSPAVGVNTLGVHVLSPLL